MGLVATLLDSTVLNMWNPPAVVFITLHHPPLSHSVHQHSLAWCPSYLLWADFSSFFFSVEHPASGIGLVLSSFLLNGKDQVTVQNKPFLLPGEQFNYLAFWLVVTVPFVIGDALLILGFCWTGKFERSPIRVKIIITHIILISEIAVIANQGF